MGVWAQLHPADVTSIITTDLDGTGRDDLVMNFPRYGVWSYLNGTAGRRSIRTTPHGWRRVIWMATV